MNFFSTKNIFGFLTLILILFFYYEVFFVYKVQTDLQVHADYAFKLFNGAKEKLANILFFLVVYIISGFSPAHQNLYVGASIALSFAFVMRYYVSNKIMSEISSVNKSSKQLFIISVFTFLLFFAAPLPMSNPFRDVLFFVSGKISPNNWHNSTTIFMFPFALLLFWQSYLALSKQNKFNLLLNIVLVAVNILIKPSFFLIYSMVYSLFLLVEYKLTKEFFRRLLPVIIGGFLLIAEFYVTYILNGTDPSDSSVGISFLEVWKKRVPLLQIPIAIMVSILFPATYFILFYKEIKEKLNIYTISYFVAGLAVYCTFIENGPRRLHGNFYWQNIICCYLLFLVALSHLLKKTFYPSGNKNEKIKIRICFSIFFLHLIGGGILLFRIFYYKTFY